MEKKYDLLTESAKAGMIIGAIGIAVFLIEYVIGFKPVGIVKPLLMLLVGIGNKCCIFDYIP